MVEGDAFQERNQEAGDVRERHDNNSANHDFAHFLNASTRIVSSE